MIYCKSQRILKPCFLCLPWHFLTGNLLHAQGHRAKSLFARLIVSQAATFCCLTRAHAVAVPNLAPTKLGEIKKTRRQATVCPVAALYMQDVEVGTTGGCRGVNQDTSLA